MGCCAAKLRRSTTSAAVESGSGDAQATEFKKVIRESPELATIANDYPKLLPAIKESLNDLYRCLDKARFGVDTILAALVYFEKERKKKSRSYFKSKKKKTTTTTTNNNNNNAYVETVGKLCEFKRAGCSLAGLHAEALKPMLEELKATMERLRRRKNEIKEILRSTKRWRKAWSVVFTAAFVGVLILSVALASTVAAPVAIAAATAAATAMRAVEPWLNYVWDEREKKLEDEKKVVEMMRDGELSVHEFNDISSLVDKLRVAFESLMENAEFAVRLGDEEAIEVGMMEIKRKLETGDVQSCIDRLKNKVDACAREIQRKGEEFHKIIRN